MAQLNAPLSLGELIDRITILEIKSVRISMPSKRAQVMRELTGLSAAAAEHLKGDTRILPLKRKLSAINQTLWGLESRSRARRRQMGSDAAGAALLRRIATLNDDRHKVKQRISRLLKGGVVEQKSYF